MTINIQDVKVDAELRDWLPAISDEEKHRLRESVKRDAGFTDPIIVWLENGTLIDGHNRYDIWKADLESDPDSAPKIVTMSFATKDEVKAWMYDRQDARRNWSASQRAIMAAKKALLGHGQKKADAQNCATQTEAAAQQKVSRSSVQTARKVLEDGAPTLVKAVTDGEVNVSDAAAILDLPKREQAAAVKDVKAGREKTVAKAAQHKSDDLLEKLNNGAPVTRSFPESKAIDDLLGQLRKAIAKPVEIVAKLREAFEAKSNACGAFGTHRLFCLNKVDDFIGTLQPDQLVVDLESLISKWEKSKKAVDDTTPAKINCVTSLKR